MPENHTSSKESFGTALGRQIANNGYSMLLETIIMLAIATYAVMEIRAVRRDVSDRVETSHRALMAYGKEQGEKLEALTTELTQTTELLVGAIGVTVEDYQANREEIYRHLKEGGSQAFKDYLKARFGPDQKPEAKE